MGFKNDLYSGCYEKTTGYVSDFGGYPPRSMLDGNPKIFTHMKHLKTNAIYSIDI